MAGVSVDEDGRSTAQRTPRVAVIGAGLSGIGMACKLRLAGIETFRIYEQRAQVGGTWWANQYPGLNCDVPSRNYQFMFAPNPGWTRGFARARRSGAISIASLPTSGCGIACR